MCLRQMGRCCHVPCSPSDTFLSGALVVGLDLCRLPVQGHDRGFCEVVNQT